MGKESPENTPDQRATTGRLLLTLNFAITRAKKKKQRIPVLT